MDDGLVKFDCRWTKKPVRAPSEISGINRIRGILFSRNLIGAYPDGTGFGNISVRAGRGFIITGTGTGRLRQLEESHYSRATGFDIEKNILACEGRVMASSEALSHAAIYESCPEINAVIHVHSPALWEKLIHRVPTTSEGACCGTREIAHEIGWLLRDPDANMPGIIVMGGHREGIITFGVTLQQAADRLLSRLQKDNFS